MLAMAIFMPVAAYAQDAPAAQGGTAEFFQKIAGEWIGTCEQSTDGERADNKYFRATVKQLSANTFESRFEYFRVDSKTGEPLRVGESTVLTTIGSDGMAQSSISGKGTVLVNNSPKPQQHKLSETVRSVGSCSLEGDGKGTISVGGMPLGLGKNGKVLNAKSSWLLNNGALTVHQTLKVGFRALVFNKKFSVVAHYTAKRGTDIAGLMAKRNQVSAGPQAPNS